jgi:low affinity Fe/Cu permease
MKRQTDHRHLQLAIDRLMHTIRQERRAFLELHQVKRQQLDELRDMLRGLLETEAELYRRKDLS